MPTTPPADITIRAPKTDGEIEAFFLFANSVFSPSTPVEEVRSWQRWVQGEPGYHVGQMRCAFRVGRIVGTCLMHERTLCLGPARLLTGCIGAVATDSAHRRQGVAGALVRDAMAVARRREYALLLLDGIPDYYRRFGFTKVFDPVWHGIDREQVLALEAGPYTVRHAAFEDASQLLDLYQRHYGTRPGGFWRELERGARDMESTPPDKRPPVAVDPAGRVRGYLTFGSEHGLDHASEAAADDWPAALALLQCHARIVGGMPEPPAELHWPLPEDGATFQILADRLPLKSRVDRRPYTGWQARPAVTPALLRAPLPLWKERWCRAALPYTGLLGIRIEGEEGAAITVRLERGRLSPTDDAPADWLSLPADAFTQLICGYRSLDRVLAERDHALPEGTRAALRALFPREPIWIPGSDAF